MKQDNPSDRAAAASDKLTAMLERCTAMARDRAAREAADQSRAERVMHEQTTLPLESPALPAAAHAEPVGQRIAKTHLTVLGSEFGELARRELLPGNEFPTPLTRLPIFPPIRRTTQQGVQSSDNSFDFKTPWGSGRRHGPPLTVRDEDVLIALMRLRDHALLGPRSKLPANVRDLHRARQPEESTEIHRVVCTISDIRRELGLAKSGENFQSILSSIKRLNACKIELDKIMSDGSHVGGAFDLIHVEWRYWDDRGIVDVVFPPIMTHWLKQSYTYVDWDIRLKLTDLGKSLQRFLASQRKDYSIDLVKLATAIGWIGESRRRKYRFTVALDELVEHSWLSAYHFTGNGRAEPYMLHTVRDASVVETLGAGNPRLR